MSMHFHRRTPDPSTDELRPSNAVHVLSDEEDLRQALQRAAAFDQRVVDPLGPLPSPPRRGRLEEGLIRPGAPQYLPVRARASS